MKAAESEYAYTNPNLKVIPVVGERGTRARIQLGVVNIRDRQDQVNLHKVCKLLFYFFSVILRVGILRIKKANANTKKNACIIGTVVRK